METCPKIPLISFELKTCDYDDPNDFGDKIQHYIFTHYQEDPKSYEKEINEFFQLRENAINSSNDFMGLNLIKKYYRQLIFLSNRFPMKSGEECASEFSWNELYSMKNVTQSDIRFELEAIMYNIGAMHSYLGCIDKRSNDDGLKISCTHFQYAAWAFQQVRDVYSVYELSEDCSAVMMTFKMNVMLAQAQECVLEKSIIDARKATINAKVSAQCVDYYKLALTNLEKSNVASVMGSRKSKEFKQYVQFKINYYSALTNYYCAINSSESKKHGEAVGYIQQAEAKIGECVKQKYLKEFQETLKHAQETIETKSKQLKKDNDFVYNEKIPAAENLPDVKGASLVKCLAVDFENDPDLVMQDIFARLVSMKAHELSSIYSEEKAKFLRDINTQVTEKNSQLESFMKALQLDELHLNDHDYLKLPKKLLECCAGINTRQGGSLAKVEIPSLMKSIVGASTHAKSILDDVQDLLEEEHEANRSAAESGDDSYSSDDDDEDDDEEEEARNRGKRAAVVKKKPPVSERKRRSRELIRRYERLMKSYNDANSSNGQLREAFDVVIKDLQLLSLPLSELSAQLPQIEIESTNKPDEPTTEETLKGTRDKLTSLLAKVDEMRQQRDQLVQRLQLALKDDDPTQTIAANQNEIEPQAFFAKSLQKHEQLSQYIRQNLLAQENILRALTEANASYAAERLRIVEASKRRDEAVERLVASYHRVEELCEKARKGVAFFESLSRGPLEELLRDTKLFCEWSKKQKQAAVAAKRPQPPPRPQNSAAGMIGNHGGLMMGEEEKEINKILASMSMLPEMSMPPFRQQGMKQLPQQPQQQQQKAMGINTFDAAANSFNDNRPKLKDFLPYMKPDSWANNSSPSSVVGPPKLDRTLFSSPATQPIQPAAPIQNPLAHVPQQQPVPNFLQQQQQQQQQQQIPIPQQQPQTQMFQPPMFQPVLQPQPVQQQQQPILQPQHFTQPQQQPVIQPTILQPQQAPLQPQVLHHPQPPAAPQFNQQQFPPQLNSYQPNNNLLNSNVPQYQSPLDFSGFGMGGGSNLPQPLMPQQISSDKPVVNSNLDSNRASASGPPKLDRTLFTASSTPNTLSLYLPSSNTSQIAPEQQQQQQFALPSFYNQPQQQIYQQFQKN